jgi:hypothetical protein
MSAGLGKCQADFLETAYERGVQQVPISHFTNGRIAIEVLLVVNLSPWRYIDESTHFVRSNQMFVAADF